MKKNASPYLGRRLLTETLQDGRAAYGGRILATVSRRLMMAELFGTSQRNVSLHLQNIYADEPQPEATHKEILSVRGERARHRKQAGIVAEVLA